MHRILSIILIIIVSVEFSTTAQSSDGRGDFRAMFYNCENLFDTTDDTLKLDDEFLPDGAKHWTWKKYKDKINKISKVIVAVGGWSPPEIIGLCEIENDFVLKGLTHYTILKKFGYEIIHYESPDRRGIDVALLFLPEKFSVIESRPIHVVFPPEMGKPTRDILYVKGIVLQTDTLHVFVNHWPSRWGGQMATEPKRMWVAALLKQKTDSIFKTDSCANILIMGDLNDYPTDKSLLESLQTKTNFADSILPNALYNISYYLQETKHQWSHKHNGFGGILDQIIVSGALLAGYNNIYTTKDNASVFKREFLLEKSPRSPEYHTFRTYIGYKYHGGYSDHLPVYIDLFIKK